MDVQIQIEEALMQQFPRLPPPIGSDHPRPTPMPPGRSKLIPQTITTKGNLEVGPAPVSMLITEMPFFPFQVFEDGSQIQKQGKMCCRFKIPSFSRHRAHKHIYIPRLRRQRSGKFIRRVKRRGYCL